MPVIPILMQTAAVCTIKIDNEQIRYNVASVKLTQTMDEHHDLEIELGRAVKDEYKIEDPKDYSEFLGKAVSVNIEPTGGKIDASHTLEFIGVVTEVLFNNSIDALNVILIRAKSPTISMDGAERNEWFSEQKASEIISSIVRNHPVTLGKVDSTKVSYRHILQHNETDMEFIRRLAGMNGLFTFYDGKEFHAVKANSNNAVELSWRGSLAGFEIGVGTSQPNYNSQLFEYEKAKELKQDTKQVPPDKALSTLSKKSFDASKEIFAESSALTLHTQVDDAQSLDEVLKFKRDSSLGKMVKCNGHSIMPDVKVGYCVKISGMEQFDGLYYVTSVTHEFGAGGKYHNNFECIPLDTAHAEYRDRRERGTLLQYGRVVDNADPEQMGRIKVKFPWINGETFWVRYLTPHAGKDRGWYCLPEIDDEVLVGFEMGNPDRPIVLGSLYNGQDTPHADTQVQENNVKMFLTKGGNRIFIRDEGGKESIEIINAEGKNSILLEAAGPAITITSKGDVAISGSNIKLKGSGDITLEADGNIKGEAGSNMELKASGNMKVEASGTQDVKGAMVNVKGNPINLN